MQFLRLVVRRAVSSKPNVQLLRPIPLAGVTDGEDLDVFRQSLQEPGQRSTQTGEPTLFTSSAAEELLHRQVWEEEGFILNTAAEKTQMKTQTL